MMTLIALFAFMLIPVWIPIIAVSCGYLYDLLRAPQRVRSSRSRRRAVAVATVPS